VHVDAERRAIVSELVVDRSLPAAIMTPSTRDAAIALLGRTLRRVHELPLPPAAHPRDPRELLATMQVALAGFPLPAFVADAVHRMRDEPPPPRERADVLSHNDVNPTNLAYDGERLLLLDWDVAGPNDPFYDVATIAVFLRFDDATCLYLLSSYDGVPVAELPARFTYSRRLVAVLCGIVFLHLARSSGHAGDADATARSLAAFYQRLRAGEVNIATPEGRWAFGLALVGESSAL
jgi:aminoglycoside phosphotransferase (APT) family kinase protein